MLSVFVTGLGAALLQSVSYVASRSYVQNRTGNVTLQLLVLSHVIMGILSIGLLVFVWPQDHLQFSSLVSPLCFTSLYYLGGQFGLLMALRHAEASKVSPMLGMKIIALALLTILLRGENLSVLQVIGILLSFGASLLLGNGDSSHAFRRVWPWVIIACVCYALSDWNIKLLVEVLPVTLSWHRFVFATASSYALCGLMAIWFLPWFGTRKISDWAGASPFAITWLGAMMLLYACFGLSDVILGNILQSTRGIISILLGLVIAHYGALKVESRQPLSVWFRRLLSGIGMTIAVTLYVWGSVKN